MCFIVCSPVAFPMPCQCFPHAGRILRSEVVFASKNRAPARMLPSEFALSKIRKRILLRRGTPHPPLLGGGMQTDMAMSHDSLTSLTSATSPRRHVNPASRGGDVSVSMAHTNISDRFTTDLVALVIPP